MLKIAIPNKGSLSEDAVQLIGKPGTTAGATAAN